MSFLKRAAIILACGYFVYNVVDDKTRAKFDNGIERQKIQVTEIKNSIYLFAWEMLGAHDDELARETSKYNAAINARKRALRERINEADPSRLPAEDDPKKYEKYLTK